MATQVETADAHDPHYEPVISLPEKVTSTMEEDEDILFKMRAKLFRWAREADPPEWKERGTGDVKLLKHRENEKIRLLMRRDKTFKICANHYLDTNMELVPNSGSDRAWVWTTFADFAEGDSREELLAIRFLNSENANKFKDKFLECQEMLKKLKESNAVKAKAQQEEAAKTSSETTEDAESKGDSDAEKTLEVTKKLEELNVEPKTNETESSQESEETPADQKETKLEDSPEK